MLNPQQLGMTPQHRRLSAPNSQYPGSDGGTSPGRHASPGPGVMHTSPGRSTMPGATIHGNDASSTPRRDLISPGSVSSSARRGGRDDVEGAGGVTANAGEGTTYSNTTPGGLDVFLARFGFGLPRGAGASPGLPSNVPFSTPNQTKTPRSGYFEYPSGGARGGGTARGALRGASGVAAAAGSPALERGAREAGAGGAAGAAAAAGDGESTADELRSRLERLRLIVLGWVNRDG